MSTPTPIPLPKIVFFGGKGGVGKTTLATATAAGLAKAERKVLLISTDPAHSLGDLLDIELGDKSLEVAPGLHVRELDPEQARADYIATVKANIRRFAAPEFLQEAERQVELSGLHPGVTESALFEALCRQLDKADRWDHLIVDTAPTGHALHLLTLPESMYAWTHALLARQTKKGEAASPEGENRWQQARQLLENRQALFERTRRRLQDAAQAGFMLVVNDDRLSVKEGARAREALGKAKMHVPALLVNRAVHSEREVVSRMAEVFQGLPVIPLVGCDPPPQGLGGLEPVFTVLTEQFVF